MSRILIGSILIEQGHLDEKTLNDALETQKKKKEKGEDKKIGEILIDEGWIEEGILLDALVIQSKKKDEN
ncbi:hypothetical protein JXA84_07655 [candidate division WOR-3 bacterium]|nr:hypothetical protein [candidate division WOR-3 bacterium]